MHAIHLGPVLPNLAVWLNSNNKITAEKQDKELLKKKKKTTHRPLGKFLFLDTEKAFTYVSPRECTVFYTRKHVSTFTKVCL